MLTLIQADSCQVLFVKFILKKEKRKNLGALKQQATALPESIHVKTGDTYNYVQLELL